jgi:hypothetical protein
MCCNCLTITTLLHLRAAFSVSLSWWRQFFCRAFLRLPGRMTRRSKGWEGFSGGPGDLRLPALPQPPPTPAYATREGEAFDHAFPDSFFLIDFFAQHGHLPAVARIEKLCRYVRGYRILTALMAKPRWHRRLACAYLIDYFSWGAIMKPEFTGIKALKNLPSSMDAMIRKSPPGSASHTASYSI